MKHVFIIFIVLSIVLAIFSYNSEKEINFFEYIQDLKLKEMPKLDTVPQFDEPEEVENIEEAGCDNFIPNIIKFINFLIKGLWAILVYPFQIIYWLISSLYAVLGGLF